MTGCELTALAEEDLRAIARYTVNTWGIEQAKHYEALLLKRFQEIAQGNITPSAFLKSRSDLLFTHCEHHYIFYWRSTDRKKPIILAILHERMDLMQRLKSRLAT